jgi:hypothetical protein
MNDYANQILDAEWFADPDIKLHGAGWVRCHLQHEANVPVCHIGHNHPPDVAWAIAEHICLVHNRGPTVIYRDPPRDRD